MWILVELKLALRAETKEAERTLDGIIEELSKVLS